MRLTWRKEHATLGAYSIVILGICKENNISKFKDVRFIEVISKILELRGHGNNVSLQVDKNDLNKLKNNVFSILKMIGGHNG